MDKGGIKKGIGEKGLMELGDCGAPRRPRPARSTIVRYHPPGTTKVKHYKSRTITKVKHYKSKTTTKVKH